MSDDVEYLLTCLFSIHISSWVKLIFGSYICLFLKLFYFLPVEFRAILCRQIFPQLCLLQIFLPICSSSFHFLTVSSAEQLFKILIYCLFPLPKLAFNTLRTFCLSSGHKEFSPKFSSKSFIVFTLRSVIWDPS